MVNRNKRDLAAKILRRFVRGEITNDDFMEQFPLDENDSAFSAIRFCVWLQLSDLKRHTLTGAFAPEPGAKELLDRCSLFLKSDFEFKWPNPMLGSLGIMLSMVTFGWYAKRQERKYKVSGDFDVWPFLTKNEYATAAGKNEEHSML